MKYFFENSRADISDFILWAEDFVKENKNTNWDEVDYLLEIEKFASEKIKNEENTNMELISKRRHSSV